MTVPDDLTYFYDDSSYRGPALAGRPAGDSGRRRPGWPGWPRLPRRRRRRSATGQRSFKLPRLHPLKAIGDALVALTSADGALIGSRHERHRYATVGVLMLVTAAQAFYAATLFFSIGLGKPFRSEIFFGVFFATAVLLIDRSIIGYAAPVKVKDGKLRPPRKTNGVLFIRIGIAIAAAILMSEMILLQVFAGDIAQQIQNDHLVATQVTITKIQADYQVRIDKLQKQIDTAQDTVNADQLSVTAATKSMNCQEFGCPGITAGEGKGFDAAQTTLQIAQQKLSTAQANLKTITAANDPAISQLDTEEEQAIAAAQPAITNADKVLSQEKAFWQLTVQNGNVLVVRLLLSLLILGIDLAPILTKLTGRTSVHDIRAHANDYHLHEQLRNETDVAVNRYGTQADTDRHLDALAMETAVIEAEQGESVKRSKFERDAEGERARHDADLSVKLHGLERDTEGKRAERDADLNAKLHRLELDTEGKRAERDADLDVKLHRIRYDAALRKLRLYRWHAAQWEGLGGYHGAGAAGNGQGAGDLFPGNGHGNGQGRDWSADDNVPMAFGMGPVPAPVAVPVPAPAPAQAPGAVREPGGMPVPPGPGPFPTPLEDVPYPPEPGPFPGGGGIPPAPGPADLGPPTGPGPAQDEAGILWGIARPPGRLVLSNRYELHERLPGADIGGGGTVWLARDLREPSRGGVVVKRVPNGSMDQEMADQLRRLGIEHEHRVAGMVGDHIGQILDHGNDGGYSYLVYPLYQPGSLEKYCQRQDGRLTLAWSAQVIDEVLSGLITASAHNLVHLDIKPGNIVLDGEHARIIDWGLSRKWDATSVWVLRGTPFYACPEQLTSPQTGWNTPTADLYGVGATFYRLITGKAPFQYEVERDGGNNPLEVYLRLLFRGDSPQPVHELVTGVPQALGELIKRWMSFEPERRVPHGIPRTQAAHVAREELRALRPQLPDMIIGRVTGRRRPR